jgi:methyl-accepting chemotaxis protein
MIKTSSLQFKVLLIAAIAMAFGVAVAVFSIMRVYGSIQELDRLSREDFQVQQQILRAEAQFKQQVQEWKNVLLRGKDPAAMEKHWKAFLSFEKDAHETIREARSGTPHEDVRNRLEAFLAAHKQAGETYRKGFEVYKEKQDLFTADKVVEGVDRAPTQMLVDVSQKAEDLGGRGVMNAVKSAEWNYRAAIAGIVVAMLVALVGLWLFIRKAVLGPLTDAARFAERIAQGDLTAESDRTRKTRRGSCCARWAR